MHRPWPRKPLCVEQSCPLFRVYIFSCNSYCYCSLFLYVMSRPWSSARGCGCWPSQVHRGRVSLLHLHQHHRQLFVGYLQVHTHSTWAYVASSIKYGTTETWLTAPIQWPMHSKSEIKQTSTPPLGHRYQQSHPPQANYASANKKGYASASKNNVIRLA